MEVPFQSPMQRCKLASTSVQLIRNWILDNTKTLKEMTSTELIKGCFGVVGKPGEDPGLIDIMTGVVNAVDPESRGVFVSRLRDKTATGCLMEFHTDFGLDIQFSKVPSSNGKGPNTVVISATYVDSDTEKKVVRTLMESTGGATTFHNASSVENVAEEPPPEPPKPHFEFTTQEEEVGNGQEEGAKGIDLLIRPELAGSKIDTLRFINEVATAEIYNHLQEVLKDAPGVRMRSPAEAVAEDVSAGTEKCMDILLVDKWLTDYCKERNSYVSGVEYHYEKGYEVIIQVKEENELPEIPPPEPAVEAAETVVDESAKSVPETQETVPVSREPAPLDPPPAPVEEEKPEPLKDCTVSIEGIERLRIANKAWSKLHELLQSGQFTSLEQVGEQMTKEFNKYSWALEFQHETLVATATEIVEPKEVKIEHVIVPSEPTTQPEPTAEQVEETAPPTEPTQEVINESPATPVELDTPAVEQASETTQPAEEPPSNSEEQHTDQSQGQLLSKEEALKVVQQYISENKAHWDSLSQAEQTALIASMLTGRTVSASTVEMVTDQEEQPQDQVEPEQPKEETTVIVRINCKELVPAEDVAKIREAIEKLIPSNPGNDALSEAVSDAVDYECVVERDPDHPNECVVTIPVDEETPPAPPDPNDPKNQLPPSLRETPAEETTPPAAELQEVMNSDKGDEPVKTNYLDLTDPNVRMYILQGLFPGVVQPSYMHLMSFLKDYHNKEKTDSFLATKGTIPTETVIVYNNITITFVKMKDGKFWRIFVAHTDLGLGEKQSWTETNHIPDRWYQLGSDIQNPNDHERGYRGGYRRY